MPILAADQRTEPRLAPPVNSSATLSVLHGSGRGTPIAVEILNASGRGARVRMKTKLDAGTLVRVDLNQTLMLGEVCYAEPDGEGFAIGLRLEHSLLQTEGLERLRQRFAEEELDSDRLLARAAR